MKWIGIAGTARTGKDEFAKFAVEFFESKNLNAKKFALANQLKSDLFPLIWEKMGIDLINPKPEDKELIRPIMVAYGHAQRQHSEGTYWTGCLDQKIEDFNQAWSEKPLNIVIVSDIRYAFYPGDENAWIKNKGGKIIHLTRKLSDGSIIGPANEEEAKHDPLIEAAADYRLVWGTTNEEERKRFVWTFLEENRGLYE